MTTASDDLNAGMILNNFILFLSKIIKIKINSLHWFNGLWKCRYELFLGFYDPALLLKSDVLVIESILLEYSNPGLRTVYYINVAFVPEVDDCLLIPPLSI